MKAEELKPISDCLELRLDNLVYNKHKELHRFGWMDFRNFIHPQMGGNYGFYAIPLTEEWLLKFGFTKPPHFTVNNSYSIGLGRNKKLSVSDVGNPNLMVWLSENEGKRVTDLVCLHNWDYDGTMYVHKLQNLFYALTGKELNI